MMLQDCATNFPLTCKQTKLLTLYLAYYPVRIVIGEWMLHSQVMSRYLIKYEYSFKNIKSVLYGVNDDIIQLQTWRHRAIQSRYKVQSTKQFIAHRLVEGKMDNIHSGPWDSVFERPGPFIEQD